MNQVHRLPAVFFLLIIVKTEYDRKCGHPVILVKRLDTCLNDPVPLNWLERRKLSVGILTDQPYATSLEATLYAYVIVRSRSDYLRDSRNQFFISNCTCKSSMCWICMLNASIHYSLEEFDQGIPVRTHVLGSSWS